jgi:predicted RNA-binding protein with EMAP domain
MSSDNSNNNLNNPLTEVALTESSNDFSFEGYIDPEKVELQENLNQMKTDFQELLKALEKEKETHKKEQHQNKQERNILIR